MWIKHPWNISNALNIGISQTPVESTNDTKHRVIGDGCICEGILLMNAWWVNSVSQCFIKFLIQSMMVCFIKRKKVVLLQVKGLI